MRSQGIYLNVSRRNDDLPEMIEEYSEKFNLSKADTVAEILRAYPKLIEYIEQRILFLIWSREHPPLRVLFFYAFF